MSMSKAEFLQEIVNASQAGKTTVEMAKDVAKRYRIGYRSVYSRYYALMTELKREHSRAKTKRKGQIKKIINTIKLGVITKTPRKVDTIGLLLKMTKEE